MEHGFFSDIEALSREEIKALQLERLKRQVEQVANHSSYYQKVFREEKIGPADFKGLDDLKRIPFIDKYMVSESQERHPPFGEFLCAKEQEIVKYFRTSGTTFHPRNFAYTFRDWWDVTVEVMASLSLQHVYFPVDIPLCLRKDWVHGYTRRGYIYERKTQFNEEYGGNRSLCNHHL
jgi:phenylacetate-coenzyme A ligase PaaK-like adenylate-forming protein